MLPLPSLEPQVIINAHFIKRGRPNRKIWIPNINLAYKDYLYDQVQQERPSHQIGNIIDISQYPIQFARAYFLHLPQFICIFSNIFDDLFSL